MLVDSYQNYTVRTGALEDVEAIYNILEPLVCDKTRHKFQYQTQQRKLRNNIIFYISKKQSLIVLRGEQVVGVYLGEDNFIVHIATKQPDLKTMALLMYNVLCKLHGRLVESKFIPLKHQDAYVFKTNLFGKESIRQEGEICYINTYAKDMIEKLYKKLTGR